MRLRTRTTARIVYLPVAYRQYIEGQLGTTDEQAIADYVQGLIYADQRQRILAQVEASSSHETLIETLHELTGNVLCTAEPVDPIRKPTKPKPPRTTITWRVELPEHLATDLKIAATDMESSLSQLMEAALREWMSLHNSGKPLPASARVPSPSGNATPATTVKLKFEVDKALDVAILDLVISNYSRKLNMSPYATAAAHHWLEYRGRGQRDREAT